MLRAYYAWKRRLPFAVTQVSGGRYTRHGNRTAAVFDNLTYAGSAVEFLHFIPQVIHTGNYRTEPAAVDSLTYPVAIGAETIRPGTVFYSPEGHTAIVTEVTEDGSIYLLDGHPDQTVTRIRFSSKLVWKSTARVGGFRAFRPVEVREGRVVLVDDNVRLPGHSSEQYELADYYGEIRQRLTRRKIDPLAALAQTIHEDIYAEVIDRAKSVELGWTFARERAIAVPPNIYAAEGDWENFSTPSRDLRLRRAFLHLPEEVRSYLQLCRDDPDRLTVNAPTNPQQLGRVLLEEKQRLFAQLKFNYRNSQGRAVSLSLNDVEQRLFRLSFDPNHPPELRWGAQGKELATASQNEVRFAAGYQAQQPWRNRLDKKHGDMSPTDADNPPLPPPHDLSAQIEAVIRDEVE
jgi:hypothetical protein